MKQFRFIIPEAQAGEFAKFCFEKEVRMLLSYAKDTGFFGGEIQVICWVATDDKTEAEKLLMEKYKVYQK